MKKLRLKALELGAIEVLTREQLRMEIGGEVDPTGSVSGSGGSTSYRPKCGTGLSCAGKSEFADCGTSGYCACSWVAGGGNMMYCRYDAG